MSRRVDLYWVRRARQVHLQHPEKKAAEIASDLEQEGARISREGAPSVRSVYRILEQPIPEAEADTYLRFHWPESLGTPDLPWEASRPLFDLLLAIHQLEVGRDFRPSLRLAKWIWRVHLAAPGLRPADLLQYASVLSHFEGNGTTSNDWARFIEVFLECRPGVSIEGSLVFMDFVERLGGGGMKGLPASLGSAFGLDESAVRESAWPETLDVNVLVQALAEVEEQGFSRADVIRAKASRDGLTERAAMRRLITEPVAALEPDEHDELVHELVRRFGRPASEVRRRMRELGDAP